MALNRNNISIFFFSLFFLIGCGSDIVQNSIKKSKYKNGMLTEKNIIFQNKIYQYPEVLKITGININVQGHNSESSFKLSNSTFLNECSTSYEYQIKELISWSSKQPDYIVPAYCYPSDSLIISSSPRKYRGGFPNAFIFDSKTKTEFTIDTKYFNDIITFIQLNRNIFLVLFDYGIQFGEEKFSFKYAIVKLDR